MKRYTAIFLAVLLMAALFTGCGCTGPRPEDKNPPTVLPTNEEVTPTTRETTRPTTVPTTEATVPTESETVDRGNGPLEDMTTETTQAPTDDMDRSRLMPRN